LLPDRSWHSFHCVCRISFHCHNFYPDLHFDPTEEAVLSLRWPLAAGISPLDLGSPRTVVSQRPFLHFAHPFGKEAHKGAETSVPFRACLISTYDCVPRPELHRSHTRPLLSLPYQVEEWSIRCRVSLGPFFWWGLLVFDVLALLCSPERVH